MGKPKKPDAESRTVDMFTKMTKLEEEKLRQELADEDAKEAVKPAETIEQSSVRWRDTSFAAQEFLSKHFADRQDVQPGQAVYRLTERGEWLFLESHRLGKNTQAYGWTGLMLHKDDLYELTGVFVKASKAKQKQEEDGTY